MSNDKIFYDRGDDVYRIRTPRGTVLGTELGGDPLMFDTRDEALDMVERREVLAPFMGGLLRPIRGTM